MRKLFILALSLTFAIGKGQTTFTWTGASSDDFEDSGNWNPIPGLGYPSFGETAIFDGSSSNLNCTMYNVEDFANIQFRNNYSGTVDASGFDLNLSGSFDGNGGGAGTFLAPVAGATMNVTGNMILGNCNFVTTAGSIITFFLNSTGARAISGNFTFADLAVTTSGAGNRTINFASVGSSTCTNLMFFGNANPMAYRNFINVTDNLTISGTAVSTPPPNNSGGVTFVGANPHTIVGTASALQNPIANLRFNTTGGVTMSGNVTIFGTTAGGALAGGTWSVANIGTFTNSSSTVNFGITSTVSSGNTTSTRAYFDNISIPSASAMVISGSSQINVSGDVTNNGTLTTNTSLIRLTGATQAWSGASTTSINAIDVASSGNKTISAPMIILDSVGVSAAGTLVAGGNVTLRSVAGQKARIGRIAAGGDVSGSVVVQNFFPSGTTGWANLCTPGLASQTMNDWNASFAITCSGCPYTTVSGVAFESINSYDETLGAGQASAAAHYVPISSLADPIVETTGYWVYLGDSYPSTGDITALMTGAINKNNSFGGYNLTLTGGLNTENGWNLISNPYPSPISLASMFAGQSANVDNSILVWDTDLNGGNGNWSVHTLGGGGDIIPMGQGFAVRALVNGIALTGNENWKNISNASCERTSSQGIFNINNLFKLNLTASVSGKTFDTYTYFDFNEGYVPGFDNGRDVYYLDNSSGSGVAQIFSRVNNESYMATAMPQLNHNQTMSFPIHIPTGYTGAYQVTAMNFEHLPDYCFELVDLGNNVKHDLFTGPYNVNVNANNGSTPRLQLNVTNCATSPAVSVKENEISGSVLINKNTGGLYVKTDFSQTTPVSISVTNVLGQKLMNEKKVSATNDMIYLDIAEKNQLLIITVTEENGSHFTKKIVY